MKKLISIIFILFFSVILCSCDPGDFVIEDEYLEGINSIELIEYNNPNQKRFSSWVPNHFEDLKPFILENCEVLEELQIERINDFKESFKNTDILHTYYAYDSPRDICIKLNYSNGNFLIIWANYKEGSFSGYIGEYSSDGTVVSFWGCFSALIFYEDLVKDYFLTELI